MQENRLKTNDTIRVEIVDDAGDLVADKEITGVHDISEAIIKVLSQTSSVKDPEACVFRVNDVTDGTSRRYRLNAHGNVKLIV